MKVTMKRDTMFKLAGEVTHLKAGQEYEVSNFDASTLRRMHAVKWHDEELQALVPEGAPAWYSDMVQRMQGVK